MASDERSRRSFARSTRTWVIQSPGVMPVVARNLSMNVAGAVNLPHGKIVAAKMAAYAPGTLFVTIAPALTATAPRALRCGSRASDIP